jgi:hypothetical protein
VTRNMSLNDRFAFGSCHHGGTGSIGQVGSGVVDYLRQSLANATFTAMSKSE